MHSSVKNSELVAGVWAPISKALSLPRESSLALPCLLEDLLLPLSVLLIEKDIGMMSPLVNVSCWLYQDGCCYPGRGSVAGDGLTVNSRLF